MLLAGEQGKKVAIGCERAMHDWKAELKKEGEEAEKALEGAFDRRLREKNKFMRSFLSCEHEAHKSTAYSYPMACKHTFLGQPVRGISTRHFKRAPHASVGIAYLKP